MAALYPLVLLSGVSALIYQVVWVREFSLLLGNTVYSAAIVSGVFVFGLGAGAYLAGRGVDARHAKRPSIGLEGYAAAELLAAVLGLALAVLIPRVESLSSWMSSYAIGESGWRELTAGSYALRALAVAALIGPATVVMGATLTFLIRYALTSSVEGSGWKVGALYGLNTLGAALGCAAVDFWMIPALGLTRTKLLAVALNLLCAAGAYGLLRLGSARRAAARAPDPAGAGAEGDRELLAAGTALALSGFCAMGMEIVWLRFLTSLYSARRPAFSMTLFAILTGMGLGALLGGALSRRLRGGSARLYAASQALFGLSVMGGFLVFIHTNKYYVKLGPAAALGQERLAYRLYEQLGFLIPALKVAFIPAVFAGAAYPLLNDFAQNSAGAVGRRAGALYLWNAAGAVLGALTAGFVLLPLLGMQGSTLVLCAGAFAAAMPVLAAERAAAPAGARRRPALAAAASATLGFAALFCWSRLPPRLLAANSILDERVEAVGKTVLKVSEGVNETALVVRQDADGTLELFTDGHRMAGTSYANQRYMRAFAHVPLLQLERPETALVICFGVGNTAHAASLHPGVSRIDVVDLSKGVLRLAPDFESANRGVLRDSRVRVHVNDGRQHLRMSADGAYDLVTLEPPPPVSAGVASLYSREFYALAARKLRKDGFITQWLPVYQVAGDRAREMIKAFIEVFPNAVLLNGYNQELILLGQKDGLNQIDWRAVRRRLEERPLVKKDLARIDLASPVELLGTFMASGRWLAEGLRDTKPLTTDRPLIEYSRYLIITTVPSELFNPATLPDWCPTCFAGGEYAPALRPLDGYLSLMSGLYSSASYLVIGNFNLSVPLRAPLRDAAARPRVGALALGVTPAEFAELLRRFPSLRGLYAPGYNNPSPP